jgi:hypothetical protein
MAYHRRFGKLFFGVTWYGTAPHTVECFKKLVRGFYQPALPAPPAPPAPAQNDDLSNDDASDASDDEELSASQKLRIFSMFASGTYTMDEAFLAERHYYDPTDPPAPLAPLDPEPLCGCTDQLSFEVCCWLKDATWKTCPCRIKNAFFRIRSESDGLQQIMQSGDDVEGHFMILLDFDERDWSKFMEVFTEESDY